MSFQKVKSIIICCGLILLFGSSLIAQKNYSVEQLANTLNQALIERNEYLLHELLHEDLSYGHSIAWIEDKKELISNNQSKFLIYEKISMDSVSVKYTDNIAVLRCQSMIDVILNDKKINLKLHICQVWINAGGKWKLIARQSTKMP
jgi:hypothetical protein